jgi:hypothetical protein
MEIETALMIERIHHVRVHHVRSVRRRRKRKNMKKQSALTMQQ